MLGEVAAVRKRNNRVTLELDAGTARIEVVVYQEVFERFQHLLAAHSIVAVAGLLRFDEYMDCWRLTAKTITDIDRLVEGRVSSLVIRWAQDAPQRLTAGKLRDILEPFRPGACDVCLYYQRGDAEARLRFGTEWRVRPSRELRERLTEAVGPDSFLFVYDSSRQH